MNVTQRLLQGFINKRVVKGITAALAVLLVTAPVLPTISYAAEWPIEAGQKTANREEGTKMNKTMEFDEETMKKLMQIMKDEDGYDDYEIKQFTYSLEYNDYRLQPVLEAYLADRTVLQEVIIDGISIKFVQQKWNCDFWHTFKYMDRCTRDRDFREKTLTMQPKQWLQFDKAAVRKIMMEEHKYTSQAADQAIYDLSDDDVLLQSALDEYVATRQVSKSFNVEGLTLEKVMFEWNCDVFCAIDRMSRWYMKDLKSARLAKNSRFVDKTEFHWGMLHVTDYYQTTN